MASCCHSFPCWLAGMFIPFQAVSVRGVAGLKRNGVAKAVKNLCAEGQ